MIPNSSPHYPCIHRQDACDIQDFVGGGTYDGEGADLGSPLDGAFVDGFNPGGETLTYGLMRAYQEAI
jgi:hypothetical protein